MRIRRHILLGVWRAVAPLVAVALVAGPLFWVVERRALDMQNQRIMAAAQTVWEQVGTGDILALFGPEGRLPPSRRAEPMRRAGCLERSLGEIEPGIFGDAVLCLTEDGRGRRYLAVGLSWRDAAPVRGWLHRWLDPHVEGFRGMWLPPTQGVLLAEEFWP